MCLTLTLTFQGHLIFVNSPFVPLHDWCKFWSDIFINSGDIAHWNMEKLPILYNGNFSLPWKRTLRFSDRCNFLQGTSDRSKKYVCKFWEESVENWRFYKSEKIVCFLWRHVAPKRDVVCQNWGSYPFFRNVFQPTRSLYDFRFKSYGILCDFYKSGDLDLDLNPNLTKILWRRTWTRVHQL